MLYGKMPFVPEEGCQFVQIWGEKSIWIYKPLFYAILIAFGTLNVFDERDVFFFLIIIIIQFIIYL